MAKVPDLLNLKDRVLSMLSFAWKFPKFVNMQDGIRSYRLEFSKTIIRFPALYKRLEWWPIITYLRNNDWINVTFFDLQSLILSMDIEKFFFYILKDKYLMSFTLNSHSGRKRQTLVGSSTQHLALNWKFLPYFEGLCRYAWTSS